jgi:sugar lactone lactonase YvrE
VYKSSVSTFFIAAVALCMPAWAQSNLSADAPVGNPELVAHFDRLMPTGVAVSKDGRIFVNFPRWGDAVEFTVAEMKNGQPIAYPNQEINVHRPEREADCLVSVQSVVVDPANRLWLLDTGSIKFGPTKFGGPKMICVDLATNKVIKKILLPPAVALRTTYLNDVRFDLQRGGGFAYITDSSSTGPNGIIVVDLRSGKSWRKLHNHPSTKAEKGFLPVVEGKPLMNRPPNDKPSHLKIGSDGIALSADKNRLFYCPLASRKLYSVPTAALTNTKLSDRLVGSQVVDHGDKGGAADGMETDPSGDLYITNYEHNAILRRKRNGEYETVVHSSQLLWPDTLAMSNDGWLYFTVNQLHRQPNFNNGHDRRQPPYALMRVKTR